MRNLSIQSFEKNPLATRTSIIGVRKAIADLEEWESAMDAPYADPEIRKALQLVRDGKLNAIQITSTGKHGHVIEAVIYAENPESTDIA